MTNELSDRQKEIIEVSLHIIAESGIQGLTIKNLARKIGFSESAVYRHYENKIQILIAILDYFKGNSTRLFIDELHSKGNSLSKIEHLFSVQFKMFSASPSLVAVIFSEELFRNEMVLLDKVKEIMNSNFETLTMIIKEGQESGEIRNDLSDAHIAIIVMGSLRHFVKQWQMSNYSFNLINEGAEFISSIRILIKN